MAGPVSHSLSFDPATAVEANHLIDLALREDTGPGLDCTSQAVVAAELRGAADFVARAPGVLCGMEVVQLLLNRWPELEWRPQASDGDALAPGLVIGALAGNARQMLLVERTCLNFMGRMSGVATLTAAYVAAVAGTAARVVDTRKTTPGWRRLEKYAVRCGGGDNHRLGLFDAILIKDNHLAALTRQLDSREMAVSTAVSRARAWIQDQAARLPHGNQTVLQIEVDDLHQLAHALAAQPDMILLDNMDVEQLSRAVALRDEIQPGVLLEASGGVRLDTIGAIARTGVDRISVGAMTHSAVNLDIGLDWNLNGDA